MCIESPSQRTNEVVRSIHLDPDFRALHTRQMQEDSQGARVRSKDDNFTCPSVQSLRRFIGSVKMDQSNRYE